VPRFHAGQLALRDLSRRCRVTIGVIGRRWGKTYFGVSEIVDDALDACAAGYPPGDYGWVAPSQDFADNGWREFEKWFSALEAGHSKGERYIRLVCGCHIWFLSANGSIRGRGFRRLVIDEGAWISKKTYEEVLLPTLADSFGKLLVITTPAGRHGWVYEEYCRAVNKEPGYGWLTRPSTDNPNPNVKEFVEFRRERMEPNAFRQEFLAEFLEDAAALFRDIDNAVGGMPEPPMPEVPYLGGADLGNRDSWTAHYVARLTGGPPYQVVFEDVFQLMGWPEQVRRLEETGRRYNGAQLVVDATGVGDAVLSMMHERGLPVRGVKILPAGQPTGDAGRIRRRDLLDNLAIDIARGAIRVPAAFMGKDKELRVELESFAIDIDDQGRTTYRSRSGNNDRVFGLALLAHGLPRADGVPTVASGSVTAEEIQDAGGTDYLEEEF
jgi:hypothetical protein